MSGEPIRQSFNRAANTYAATALLQQQVAEQLVRDLYASMPTEFSGLLLDAGCGTGYCLTQLATHYPTATRVGIDFAESMLQTLPDHDVSYRINGDLQQLPLKDACVDLYVSSLAWQWCNLEQAIHEAARVLKPGGQLWLTTLVEGTFQELRDTLVDAGLTPEVHVLAAAAKEHVLLAFQSSPLQVVTTRCDALTTLHPDFAELRRSIRGVGANHVPTRARETITKAIRRRLLDAYESRRTSHGLPLTYNVLTLHAQRI